MDMNKVWLTGLAVTQPVLTKLPNQTPFTIFTLQVNERYVNRTGVDKVRPNLLRVECLGRTAALVAEEVQCGLRYAVDGYLRYDELPDREDVRVRAWKVYRDTTPDAAHHNEGLKQALQILKKCRNISSAKTQLEELIKT